MGGVEKPQLTLRLLGAPQAEINGRLLETDRRKAVALLAYLAVTAVSHTRDFLATLLWPDFDQSRAYAYLRRTLWELNNALGTGWLEVEREQVALKNQEVWLDTAVFQSSVAAFRADNQLAHLAEAVDLYRGDFLIGFTLRDSPDFDDWQRFQAEQLRRELAWALEQLAVGYSEKGEGETAISYARRWLSLDPLQEAAHRQLMHLYTSLGDRTAALHQYENCVRLLEEDLGVKPEAATTALYEQIKTSKRPHITPSPLNPAMSSWHTSSPPHPPSSVTIPHSLPTPPTPFVGRNTELAEIGRLLLDPACRLLTLLGPGGSGKTRLSIQTAVQTAESFADGVYFVPLAPLSSSDSIIPTLASILNFAFYKQEGSESRQQLLDYLRQKQMLLVIDNLEHLLDDHTPQLLADILATAPQVKLLATSRSRVNVQGEQLFAVPGMRTPGENVNWHQPEEAAAYSALQLFRQVATRVQPGFQLTAENLPYIVRICQMVQGMPLAIELAAAWMELLTPAQIAEEVAHSLDFLETEMHDIPERQRSLRAVFNTSWRLLTEEERQVFQKLTIFWGGFTSEAARSVSSASLKTLLALVNKSWLQRGENGRYQIHVLLLQYAYELLSQNRATWEEAKEKHALFYAHFLQQQREIMLGAEQQTAYEAVTRDFENIRSAWFWLTEHKRFDVLIEQMLPSLLRFGVVRPLTEEMLPLIQAATEQVETAVQPQQQLYQAILLTEKAVFLQENWSTLSSLRETSQQAWDIATSLGTKAFQQMGMWYVLATTLFAWNIDRPTGIQQLRRLLPELRQSGDRWWLAWTTKTLGQLLHSVNERAEGHQLMIEALTLYQELGDPFEQAIVLENLGQLARDRAEYGEAKRLYLAACDLHRTVGSLIGVAFVTYSGLAELEIQQGHFEQAFQYIAEGRAILMQIGNRRTACNTLHWESLNALRYSTLEHARQTRQQQLSLAHEIQESGEIAWGSWEMGEICRYEGDYQQAQRWFEEARTFFDANEERLGMGFYHRGIGEIALAQGQYNKALYHFQEYGRLTSLEHFYWSVAYADTLLGWVYLRQEKLETAYQHFVKSLQMAQQLGNRDLYMAPLAGLAGWLLATGQPAEAARLSAFVQHHFLTWREIKEQAVQVWEQAATQLPIEVATTLRTEGQQMKLETAVQKFM